MTSTDLPTTRDQECSLIPLSLQKQPTPTSCVQTCLAMAMHVPVEDVIAVTGDFGLDGEDLVAWLRRCRIRYVRLLEPTLLISGWYFAVVPSLNIRGGMHQVLLGFHASPYRLTVLDPSMKETYARDGQDLRCWREMIYFIPGGRLPGLPD